LTKSFARCYYEFVRYTQHRALAFFTDRRLREGGENIKAYTSDWNEVKKLLADGYTVVSMAYFVANPIVAYTLEKK